MTPSVRNASSVRRRPTPSAPAARPASISAREAALQSNAIERPSTVSTGRPRSAVSARRRRASALIERSGRLSRTAGEGSIETTPSSPSRTSRLPSSIRQSIGAKRRPPSARRATARRWPRARSRSPRRARTRRCGRRRARALRPRRARARARRGSSRRSAAPARLIPRRCARPGARARVRPPRAPRAEVSGSSAKRAAYPLRGRERGGRRRQPRSELTHPRVEGRILGHQPIRLQDLGLVHEAVVAECAGGTAELQCRLRKCGRVRPRVRHGLPRHDLAQHDCPADDYSGGGAEAAQHRPLHQASAATERSSAATMRAVDVAPGSWWPIERSPR